MQISNDTELNVGVKLNDEYCAYVKIKEPDELSDIKIWYGPGYIYVVNKKIYRGFYADFN